MVKADAYGHGRLRVAEYTQDAVDAFGVASAAEGAELRGITDKPILVTGRFADESRILAEYKLTPLISSLEELSAYAYAVKSKEGLFPIHFKIDTGMNRLGFKDVSLFRRAVEKSYTYQNLYINGIATHYFSHESDIVKQQTERFLQLAAPLKRANPALVLHTSASNGVECFPQYNFDMVRVGLLAYGYSECVEGFLPALRVSGEILQIKEIKKGESVGYSGLYISDKDAKIGIVGGGYFDGVPMFGAVVSVGGTICPLIGRTSMDLSVVDLSGTSAKVGDEAVFLGENCDAAFTAMREHTIPYEVLTRYTTRNTGDRTYVQSGTAKTD